MIFVSVFFKSFSVLYWFYFEVETDEREYHAFQILNKVVEGPKTLWITGSIKNNFLYNYR